MTLSEALKGVTVSKMFQTMYGKMVTTHDVKISGVQYDSRKVQRENLFVALKGTGTDGHRFLSSAIAAGAKVIVVEDDASIPDPMCMHTGTVKVVVPNTRAALARIAANYYGRPAEKMTMIGVTGTNGKTTTTFLIKQLLESAASAKVGLIGTVEYAIGAEKFPATHTTPESLELHQMFGRMAAQGCTHCVMEVSSHALHQHRVEGIPFAAAVFTNLTQDHLDYHGTMEEYSAAKKILFNGLNEKAVAVVNADSEYADAMLNGINARMLRYAIDRPSDIQAQQLSVSVNGSAMVINGNAVATPLIGRFNVYNFLAAYGVMQGLGVAVTAEQCAALIPAPGRFERIAAPSGWTAIVDYAHTPDALENCLQTVHDVLPQPRTNRIITVFGAGGDRDRTKRPKMGAIAERLSDTIIVTSDNPRTEDPLRIIEDIMTGIVKKENAVIEPDRAAAIRAAANMASAGDVVLIAGKGHEDYQVIGTEKHHFSDKEEITRTFA